MKIKALMDFLSKESPETQGRREARRGDTGDVPSSSEEKVVYIDNARLDADRESLQGRELLASGTQWAKRRSS